MNHIPPTEHGNGGSKQLEIPQPGSFSCGLISSEARPQFRHQPSNSMAANFGNKIRNAKLVRFLSGALKFSYWFRRRSGRGRPILIANTGLLGA
jgi:hypothetical protein